MRNEREKRLDVQRLRVLRQFVVVQMLFTGEDAQLEHQSGTQAISMKHSLHSIAKNLHPTRDRIRHSLGKTKALVYLTPFPLPLPSPVYITSSGLRASCSFTVLSFNPPG